MTHEELATQIFLALLSRPSSALSGEDIDAHILASLSIAARFKGALCVWQNQQGLPPPVGPTQEKS